MSTDQPRPRIRAVFGLTLLEALRDQDLPSEFLEDEVPSVTMPRRLGLSDVVEKQIRIYRESVRQRTRMTDDQARDLIRLVIRRPDAAELFHRAGRMLGEREGGILSIAARVLPRRTRFRLARRAGAAGLNRLFGRRMGGFARGPFALEGRGLLFMEGDPAGRACHFVSGFCQAVVSARVGPEYVVVHSQCEARGDPVCRWTVTGEARQRERDGVREMLLRPEFETG
ncbi:MAG: 4-vinyl reductase [Longimicrobiales bacterium]|nr:4-vinyl reductase [Longimicrobiales bacterium]